MEKQKSENKKDGGLNHAENKNMIEGKVVKCPECGYIPDDGAVLTVHDWNLMGAEATVVNGKLSDPSWEVTSTWKNEEEITCPECGASKPKEEWNIRWNWE